MKQERARTDKKGFVLIVVLGMVIVLTVVLLGFSRKAQAGLSTADDFLKSQQALNCAKSGLNIAIALVRDNPDIQQNEKLKDLFLKENIFSVGSGSCSVTITPENGKLNINMLKDENAMPDRARIDQMLRLIELLKREYGDHIDIGYGIVPAIMDWTDADEEVTYLPFVKYENSGAESSFYRQLPKPYKCRNKPLEVLEELLLIKAMTPEIFELLQGHITIYGDGQINVNCASEFVIQSLSEKIDPVLAATGDG